MRLEKIKGRQIVLFERTLNISLKMSWLFLKMFNFVKVFGTLFGVCWEEGEKGRERTREGEKKEDRDRGREGEWRSNRFALV